MDFLKKHIGLVISTVIFLILVIVLAVVIVGKGKNVAEATAKIKEQQDMLQKISTGGRFALGRKNVEIARQNREVIATEIDALLLELHRKSRIEKQNISALAAVRFVKDQVRIMRESLEAKDILAGAAGDSFSFSSIVATRTLPPAAEVPLILRQVSIVKEVVNWAVESYLTELKTLSRPQGLEVVDKGNYTVTPLRMTVVGGLPQIQEFINALQNKSKYLFFVRSINFTSAQRQVDSEIGRAGSRVDRDRQTESDVTAEIKGPEVIKPRNERIAFKPGQLTVDIEFELLEFKNPNPEIEE